MNKIYDQLNSEFKQIQKNNQVQLRFFPELKKKVDKATSFLDHRNPTNSERIYCIKNYITKVPRCGSCKVIVKYNTKTVSYNSFCSAKCSNSNKEKIKKAELTFLRKYGVKNPMQNEDIKNKSINNNSFNGYSNLQETMKVKYGIDHPMKSDEFKNKQKQTVLANYGVDNVMRNDEIRNKVSFLNSSFDKFIARKGLVENFKLLFTKEEFNGVRHDKKYKFQCLKCSKEFEDYVNHYDKLLPKCPKCNPKSESAKERELKNFIMKIYNGEVILNSKKILPSRKELDVFLPELKIAFEFNGLYWHSEQRGKDQKYHLNKLDECNSLGIRLIQIFEDEWISKNKIVKSKIRHLLRLNNKEKIFARNCSIVLIDSKIKNKFLDLNHIQGKDSSSINLGLIYKRNNKNILVSVMTFTKPRRSLGHKKDSYDYELSRFASNSKYLIVGGFSKLLTYFKRNYEWDSLVSYADLRWSDGNVYEKNGWILSHQSKPGYWYVDPHKRERRYHRYGFRKQSLKSLFPDIYDDNKSERQIMNEVGYLRVWDCGNLVFKLKR